MKFIYASLTIFITVFSSCSYSASDFTEDLGQGYLFVSESKAHQIISGPNDTTWSGLIPCTVDSYDFDGFFIIVRQKSNSECLKEDISKLPVSYWIIDKKKN